MIRDLLYKRRSRRTFRSIPVEREKIDTILEAALLSPSSRSIFPWEFIVIDDPAALTRLSAVKEHGSAFLQGAPLAIVIAADGNKSDVWVEDCSIAATLIQLAAEELGLGSCWIQIRRRTGPDGISSEELTRHICKLPEAYSVDSIIAIGYSDEEKPPHEESELRWGQVHFNRYIQAE